MGLKSTERKILAACTILGLGIMGMILLVLCCTKKTKDMKNLLNPGLDFNVLEGNKQEVGDQDEVYVDKNDKQEMEDQDEVYVDKNDKQEMEDQDEVYVDKNDKQEVEDQNEVYVDKNDKQEVEDQNEFYVDKNEESKAEDSSKVTILYEKSESQTKLNVRDDLSVQQEQVESLEFVGHESIGCLDSDKSTRHSDVKTEILSELNKPNKITDGYEEETSDKYTPKIKIDTMADQELVIADDDQKANENDDLSAKENLEFLNESISENMSKPSSRGTASEIQEIATRQGVSTSSRVDNDVNKEGKIPGSGSKLYKPSELQEIATRLSQRVSSRADNDVHKEGKIPGSGSKLYKPSELQEIATRLSQRVSSRVDNDVHKEGKIPGSGSKLYKPSELQEIATRLSQRVSSRADNDVHKEGKIPGSGSKLYKPSELQEIATRLSQGISTSRADNDVHKEGKTPVKGTVSKPYKPTPMSNSSTSKLKKTSRNVNEAKASTPDRQEHKTGGALRNSKPVNKQKTNSTKDKSYSDKLITNSKPTSSKRQLTKNVDDKNEDSKKSENAGESTKSGVNSDLNSLTKSLNKPIDNEKDIKSKDPELLKHQYLKWKSISSDELEREFGITKTDIELDVHIVRVNTNEFQHDTSEKQEEMHGINVENINTNTEKVKSQNDKNPNDN